MCLNAQVANSDDFVIIDVHGVHEIGLDFCGCETAQIHYIQLLRARLFPATSAEPRTAATFAVLEMFHLLSFESKVSAYEFYHSLARRSDNTGITTIKVVFRCPRSSSKITNALIGPLFCLPANDARVAQSKDPQTFWKRS
jgi:hypothetical protein